MEQSNEQWWPIDGYEAYEVSTLGRVRRGGRILNPYPIDQWGHLSVGLWRNGRRVSRQVHHLVLEAFIGERPQGAETLHGDGDASNNLLSNLRWGTHSENEADRVSHGTHNNAAKSVCPRGHVLRLPNRAHSEAYRTGNPITQEMADRHYWRIV